MHARPQTPDEDGTMSLGEHLEELRSRVLWAVGGLLPIFAISLFFADTVLDWLIIPLQAQLRAKDLPQVIQATGPIETFGAYVRVAFVLTIIAGGPWIMWHFWRFVRPGLHTHERRFTYLLMPLSGVLTVSAIAFLYFVLLPVVLAFFISFGSNIGARAPATAPLPAGVVLPEVPVLAADPAEPRVGEVWINRPLREYRICVEIKNDKPVVLGAPLTRATGITQQYRVAEYVKLVFQLSLAFAIGFQMPIVIMLLAWSGLVPLTFMAKNRKYMLVVCTIAGAILTPADPISLVLLAAPLYLLYELGMVLARFVTPSLVAGDKPDGERSDESGQSDGDA